MSGSKTIISYLSSISPAGCYTTVLNWFKHKTSEEVVYPKNNDVITYFDNNQIIARNWRVRYNAKAMLSIITSVIHIELDFKVLQILIHIPGYIIIPHLFAFL